MHLGGFSIFWESIDKASPFWEAWKHVCSRILGVWMSGLVFYHLTPPVVLIVLCKKAKCKKGPIFLNFRFLLAEICGNTFLFSSWLSTAVTTGPSCPRNKVLPHSQLSACCEHCIPHCTGLCHLHLATVTVPKGSSVYWILRVIWKRSIGE